ncbi:hypothetical protein ACVNP3_09440 [Pseudomonas chlororaphis subsp. piscium]
MTEPQGRLKDSITPNIRPSMVGERSAEGLFIVDALTGEIIDQALNKPAEAVKVATNVVDKYVGIDTRFPSEVRDAAELIEATEVHDPFLKNLSVDYQKLFELMDYGKPVSETMVFRYLCEHLTAWNCWIGSMDELAEAFPHLSQRSLFAILKNLEDGLIRRTSKGSRGPSIIRVHPWYAFRGATYIRDELLARWCRPSAGSLLRVQDN